MEQSLEINPSFIPSKDEILNKITEKFEEQRTELLTYCEVDLESEIDRQLNKEDDGYLVPWQRIGLRKRAVKHKTFKWGKATFELNYNLVKNIITIKLTINDLVEHAKYLRKAFRKTKSRKLTVKIKSISISQDFSLTNKTGKLVVVQHKIKSPEVSTPSFDVSGGGKVGAWIVERLANKKGKGRVIDSIKSETRSRLEKQLPRYAASALKYLTDLVNGYQIIEPGLIAYKGSEKAYAKGRCQNYGFSDVLDSKWKNFDGDLEECLILTCSL